MPQMSKKDDHTNNAKEDEGIVKEEKQICTKTTKSNKMAIKNKEMRSQEKTITSQQSDSSLNKVHTKSHTKQDSMHKKHPESIEKQINDKK